MAVLLMDNAQWQQHTNEELKRRQQEEQQNILAQQQAAAVKAKLEAEARAQEAKSEKIIITDDPWFYADPQGNVQVSLFKSLFWYRPYSMFMLRILLDYLGSIWW
jgi:hypothetical protein